MKTLWFSMLMKEQQSHKLKELFRNCMKLKLEKSMYKYILNQVLNTFGGKKKAYIRLGGENDALNLANKIGII